MESLNNTDFIELKKEELYRNEIELKGFPKLGIPDSIQITMKEDKTDDYCISQVFKSPSINGKTLCKVEKNELPTEEMEELRNLLEPISKFMNGACLNQRIFRYPKT